MDNENGDPQEGHAAKDIPTEDPAVFGSQGQQTHARHSNGSSKKPTYKQRITKWFSKHFRGHKALEWLTFVFEVLTFFALCVYSYFSYKQWQSMQGQKVVMQGQLDQMTKAALQTDELINEARKSAEAARLSAETSRLQAKGTEAAIVQFDLGIDESGIKFIAENRGHVIAEDVTATIVITRRTWPGKKLVSGPVKLIIGPGPLPKFEYPDQLNRRNMPIPGVTKQSDWDAILNGEQFVTAEWAASYGNGFGDTVEIPRKCQSVIMLASVKTKNMTYGGWSGLCACDEFDAAFTQALKSKKEAEAKLLQEEKR